MKLDYPYCYDYDEVNSAYGENKMKITKTQLREIIREELLNEEHPEDDDAYLELAKQAEDFGKALKKFAGNSRYERSVNLLIKSAVKQFKSVEDIVVKKMYRELLK
ncbi:hypothetical protein H8D04_01555 [bacterium]|nr:hypothetical protein [bacterium]